MLRGVLLGACVATVLAMPSAALAASAATNPLGSSGQTSPLSPGIPAPQGTPTTPTTPPVVSPTTKVRVPRQARAELDEFHMVVPSEWLISASSPTGYQTDLKPA